MKIIKNIHLSIVSKFSLLMFIVTITLSIVLMLNSTSMFKKNNQQMILNLITSQSFSLTRQIEPLMAATLEEARQQSKKLQSSTSNKLDKITSRQESCLYGVFHYHLNSNQFHYAKGGWGTSVPSTLVQSFNETILQEYLSREYDLMDIAKGQAKILPLKVENNTSAIAYAEALTIEHKGKMVSQGLSVYIFCAKIFDVLRDHEAVYSLFLMNEQGKILFATDESSSREFINDLNFINSVKSGLKFYEDNSTIYGFSKVKPNLIAVAQISKNVAMESLEMLIARSTLISVIIVCISLLIGYAFAFKMLRPLVNVTKMAKAFGEGRFNSKLPVISRDEIGVLTDTLNTMGSQIVDLLESKALKARMESELLTAQQVQQTLFPVDDNYLDYISISGYYQPATECGGDWWGYYKLDNDRVLLLVGDATGHGVGSALMTAVAKGATSIIGYIMQWNNGLPIKPSHILAMLNRVILESSKGQVLMTFIVTIIDHRLGKLTYANASHTPGYLLPAQPAKLSKSDIVVLNKSQGRRLGEKMDSTFQDVEQVLQNGDTLVLFTDGITEGTNLAGEMYSTGRFLRALSKGGRTRPSILKTNVLESFHKFTDGAPLHDDVTLVISTYHG